MRYYPILFILVILIGCTKPFEDLQAFENYYYQQDSPYIKSLTSNGILFQLRFIPTEAMLISEVKQLALRNACQISDVGDYFGGRLSEAAQQHLSMRKAEYEKSLYFHLSIRPESNSRDLIYSALESGFENYNDWLNTFLFKLNESIYIKTSTIEEIQPSIYRMERTFGHRPERNLIIAFPAIIQDQIILESEYLTFFIDEFGLGSGKTQFEFNLPFPELLVSSAIAGEYR